MAKFDLDKHFSKFSDLEVFLGIKYLTSTKNKEIDIPPYGLLSSHGRLLCIADMIGHIKHDKLLRVTIHYLKWLGWLNDETQIENILFEVDGWLAYDITDGIKIKALSYSALFKYELSGKLLLKNIKAGGKNLVFKFSGRKFSHNADDLVSESVVLSLGEVAKSLGPNHRLKMLTNLVDLYSQKEFEEGNKLTTRARKHFYTLKQNYSLNPSLKKTYPFISNEISETFTKYVGRHIIEPYVDHSYLFQRLKDENLLMGVKHRDFMKWLFDGNFITIAVYNRFLEKGNFRSLDKSTTPERENNFNNLFVNITTA